MNDFKAYASSYAAIRPIRLSVTGKSTIFAKNFAKKSRNLKNQMGLGIFREITGKCRFPFDFSDFLIFCEFLKGTPHEKV